jgi:hypothetical protein
MLAIAKSRKDLYSKEEQNFNTDGTTVIVCNTNLHYFCLVANTVLSHLSKWFVLTSWP